MNASGIPCMGVRILDSLASIAAERWNALDLHGNPLVRHEFLLALEQTGCATAETGWQARHVVLENADGSLLGALPLYLKPHSWGEFVFDWSWASAYARLGLTYYPKLVSAVPFTPASGPRLLVCKNATNIQSIRELLVDTVVDVARREHISSIHVLFSSLEEQQILESKGFIARNDCQFHWRNDSFNSFEAFVATFRADKRKKALRERRKVAEAGIRFLTLHGEDLTEAQWAMAMQLSAATFHSHGNEHYLNVDFFRTLSKSMPKTLMLKFAMLGEQTVAVAIFFRSESVLYGRYWGAAAEYDSLHFETCYYQGIDYCIEHRIDRFEPGTQGEHKIARGFAPTKTGSAHWIADPRLNNAIRLHAEQERAGVDRYIAAVNEHLPFHRDRV